MKPGININTDLFISRYGHGIKLRTPCQEITSVNENNKQTVGKLFEQPFNIYFVNNVFELNKVNSTCAESCGFDSESSAIGKKANDFLNKESAHLAVSTDQEVMLENNIKIFEQELIRQDETIHQYLTIKSPWYDNQNNIIGILGCSIIMGKHPLAESLQFISDLGLLTPTTSKLISSLHNNSQLSKQQVLCAKHLLDGLSAKQIAIRLNLSHRTVEKYIANMKYKLKCTNKTELILKLSDLYKDC